MERIGFSMRLLPGSEAEYRRRHAAVWPDLLADLRSAGARNYSIFLRGDDLFAYLEVDDFAAFTAAMACRRAAVSATVSVSTISSVASAARRSAEARSSFSSQTETGAGGSRRL